MSVSLKYCVTANKCKLAWDATVWDGWEIAIHLSNLTCSSVCACHTPPSEFLCSRYTYFVNCNWVDTRWQ